MSADGPCALLVTGAVGVGKTTVTDAVGEELAARGIPSSALDLDWLRRSWPTPADDPFHHRLELATLQAVVEVHRSAGAQVLVAAGVIEGGEDRPDYEAAFGCPVTVVRLMAPRDLVRERLHHRHELDPEGLAWHLARFDELTAILDDAGGEDVQVPIQEDPPATARAVLEAARI
ncbi:AAA family ATPase [Brachybacterium sacelli]|uniref:Kinase n=1 Tax=Brachybacterium sacelli TaxID=173364 RepID=A0ABS4WZU2_9MICO|nr:AAA family ATPase [Brachybacterium sacelli]MBP2381720.1 putative kinase [Brachybacterium sacelli]